MSNMTDEQLKFAKTRNQHVIALASAGAGKTHSLIHFIHDKMSDGVKPEEIISFSFTRKAANELKERINKFFEKKNYNFKYISTIHSFCWNELIKIYFKEIGYTCIPTIVHDLPEEFMENEYKTHGKKKDKTTFTKGFLNTISKDFQKEDFDAPESVRLLQYLVQHNLVMFDLMIHLANFILEDVDCIENVKKTFNGVKYIITDEAQDLNPAQYRFIVRLRDVTGDE